MQVYLLKYLPIIRYDLEANMCYNNNLQPDFNRPETKALSHTKEVACKTPKIMEFNMSNYKHGLTETRQYTIWLSIKNRCTKKSHKFHSKYKGMLPDKWKTFDGFWEDMSEDYSDLLTIDRIDNSKGYSKENCRWTSRFVQNQNRGKIKRNKTGIMGVSEHPTSKGRFVANVTAFGKRYYLGFYENPIVAGIVRDTFIVMNGFNQQLNFERLDNG